MANRSTKVVLSVRVKPYLKDALDLLSKSKNKKIVETVEQLIDAAIEETKIKSPFWALMDPKETREISIHEFLNLLWSTDPIIYKLRLSNFGDDYLDEPLYKACCEVWENEYFYGDDDIFSETRKTSGFPLAIPLPNLNLQKIRQEWKILTGFGDFSISNKPMIVTYEQYKKMLPN